MCRSCADGGRRCARTATTRKAERSASARYYKRGKARRKIADLAAAGIPAITDSDMPTSYHRHHPERPFEFDPERRTLANPAAATSDKPEGAVLWTSPGRVDSDGHVKTAWSDWSNTSQFGDFTQGQLVAVHAEPGAVIATVHTSEDADRLLARYGHTNAVGKRAFDWVAMKNDGIDAVHLSSQAANAANLGPEGALDNFYAWDASSTVWLSPQHLSVGEQHQLGHYEFSDAQEAGDPPSLIIEDGHGKYDEPQRPDLEAADGRVPKRFAAPVAPDAVAPETKQEPAVDPADPSARPRAQKDPTEKRGAQPGSAGGSGPDALDAFGEFIGAAAELRAGKGKKAKARR